jgi:hypothetical protein
MWCVNYLANQNIFDWFLSRKLPATELALRTPLSERGQGTFRA